MFPLGNELIPAEATGKLGGRLSEYVRGTPLHSYPTVLVLEDDPAQLPGIAAQLAAECKVDVVQARSAADAKRRLLQRQNTPMLAIIDWDMHMSPDQSLSVPALLSWLRKFERGCYTILYTIRPEILEINTAATLADPLVHFQAKSLGIDALIARVKAITGVTVGDLSLVGNQITCMGTDQHYFHEVARRLMSAFPRELDLARDDTSRRAATRFNHWLALQNSSVRVEAVGHRHFRLAVVRPEPSPESTIPSDGAEATGAELE